MSYFSRLPRAAISSSIPTFFFFSSPLFSSLHIPFFSFLLSFFSPIIHFFLPSSSMRKRPRLSRIAYSHLSFPAASRSHLLLLYPLSLTLSFSLLYSFLYLLLLSSLLLSLFLLSLSITFLIFLTTLSSALFSFILADYPRKLPFLFSISHLFLSLLYQLFFLPHPQSLSGLVLSQDTIVIYTSDHQNLSGKGLTHCTVEILSPTSSSCRCWRSPRAHLSYLSFPPPPLFPLSFFTFLHLSYPLPSSFLIFSKPYSYTVSLLAVLSLDRPSRTLLSIYFFFFSYFVPSTSPPTQRKAPHLFHPPNVNTIRGSDHDRPRFRRGTRSQSGGALLRPLLATLGMTKLREWPDAAIGYGKKYPEFWINAARRYGAGRRRQRRAYLSARAAHRGGRCLSCRRACRRRQSDGAPGFRAQYHENITPPSSAIPTATASRR